MAQTIRPKDRDTLIQALRSGVVPRIGQHLIQVGRVQEIEALIKNIDSIADEGTAFRLVIGEYGSGKTFFLNLVRAIALKKDLVATTADLNPDRRLQGASGQARSLYAELAKNLSTRTKPDGGALTGIVEKFIYTASTEAKQKGVGTDVVIQQKLAVLSEMVNGYDFARVIEVYWTAAQEGNEQKKADAVRWLRGEFTTKTEARNAIGVRNIVEDANIYDQIKLLSVFVRLAGFSGLLICLDEMVNLYKISNAAARNANYEQILRILNDVLQGSVKGLGFLLGGTPEFLMDTRRGLFSYAALQSRLAENTFATNGLVDFNHPVVRLSSLTQEDFLVLLHNIQTVFVLGDESKCPLPDEALTAFMNHCQERIGEAYFRTPRTTITSFVNLLAVLEQNPSADWRKLIGDVSVVADRGGSADSVIEPDAPAEATASSHDEFAKFKL